MLINTYFCAVKLESTYSLTSHSPSTVAMCFCVGRYLCVQYDRVRFLHDLQFSRYEAGFRLRHSNDKKVGVRS